MESAKKRSAWLQDSAPQSFAPLRGSRRTDVLVVGGGITGLTTALLLKERGKSVVLLEASRIAGGASGYTSAHLTTQLERSYRELIKSFGAQPLRRFIDGRKAAVAHIAAWVDQHRIDCDFRRVPGFWYAEDHDQRRDLERELAAVQEVDPEARFTFDVPWVRARAAIAFANQAQLQPVTYLRALAVQVHGDGCFVFEGSPVQSLHDGVPCVAVTPGGEVRADQVVLATHTPIGRTVLHTELAPYRSYVIAATLGDGSPPEALFWDDAEPYHYVRTFQKPDGRRLLVIGGEDHKTGQTKDERRHYAALERYAKERFDLGIIEHSWSTELFDSIDGLPYVGHLGGDRHTFVATGYGGDGLTCGTLAAQVLADELTGRQHPLEGVLSPRRIKPLAGGKRFVRENANVARHFLEDRLKAADQPSLEALVPGQGGLVTIGGKKVAAYRDEHGALHTFSAVCQHLKCIVQWNPAERTWDCPCHGGRYAPTGEVISGPPMQGLTPVGKDEPK